jgi:hypothetical protein
MLPPTSFLNREEKGKRFFRNVRKWPKTVMIFQTTGEYKISKVKFLKVSNHNWNIKPESQAADCHVVMVFVRGSEAAYLANLKVRMNQETTNGAIHKADLYSVPMRNR